MKWTLCAAIFAIILIPVASFAGAPQPAPLPETAQEAPTPDGEVPSVEEGETASEAAPMTPMVGDEATDAQLFFFTCPGNAACGYQYNKFTGCCVASTPVPGCNCSNICI